MKKIWGRFRNLSNRSKTSVGLSIATLALISTVMSVAGVSLHDWTHKAWLSIAIIIAFSLGILLFVHFLIGVIYKDSVSFEIRNTPVTICYGNIFDITGWKVIGCDTHFETRVDDIVISKKSLHGQFVLEHGNIEEIREVVNKKAEKLELEANSENMYDFPLGTIIPYHSSIDNQTYLMLAMSQIDSNHEAHTNMAKHEQMLMRMWTEINSVYASNDIVLPLLGEGITRFDDGPKDKEALLKCMLCTLNASGVSFNSEIRVALFQDKQEISLYEYKDMFRSLQRR